MDNARKFYINGAWVEPSTTDILDVINPSTEQSIASIAMGGTTDVDGAVAHWRRVGNQHCLCYRHRPIFFF